MTGLRVVSLTRPSNISFKQHLKCSNTASNSPGVFCRVKYIRVASSLSKMLNTSIAHEDSAKSPDFRHISSRHTSMSDTSLQVNLRFFMETGLVFSTEFFGNVINSLFSITLGTLDGLAGVELTGGAMILVGV